MKRSLSFCSAVCCCISFALPCAADVGQPASPERRCERHYDFRAKLCQVHEHGVRDAAVFPAADDFVFADGAAISIPGDSDEVLYTAARDFEDYLWTSMGVAAAVSKGTGGGVSVALDASLDDRQYKVFISPDGVRIRARDSRAAAQALYHLEDLMNLRRAPYLAAAEEDRAMLFSPRMTHSGFACDEFPDPYLARIAHAGMDAILVFVKDVDKTKGHPEYQDVNDTIRRAKRFGIDTYLYSYVHAFAHPDQGPAPFDASYGRVSAAYPEARGIILVGESCEFPSKDPRVIPIAAQDRGKEHEGDVCPTVGYFPCSDFPQWVKAVVGAVRRHNPGCDVVFWTYNWGGEKDECRRAFLENLQKDVSLMATWEMFDRCVLPNGYSCRCADYTQTFAGPGRYFRTEAQWAKEFGLRLYTQSCTGGITWDFGSVPYLPVPHHWKLRWDGMVSAHGEWGLSGLMEGHHQGWYPNFVSELAKEAFTRGGIPFEKHIRMIAARDFGEANAEAVVAAWQKWSDASAYIAPTHANQYGMFRTGPSYPFNALGPRIQAGIGGDGSEDYPQSRHAPNGLGICRLNYADDQLRQWREGLDYFPRLVIPADELRLELDGLRTAYGLFMDGAATLRRAAEGLSGGRRDNALKVAGLGEYMGRTCRTAVNVKAATAEEDVVLSKTATESEKAAARARIIALARDEYENAKAALPLVDADSLLGWEPTMEYCGGREQIEWKLRRMERLYGVPCARQCPAEARMRKLW